MKKLRVLALCEESLVPPESSARKDVVNAEWRMEFDVVKTLREEGHEVQALGVGSELGVIRKAIQEFKPDVAFNLLMAASTLIVLPVVIIFIVAQRFFIEGITVGGVKG